MGKINFRKLKKTFIIAEIGNNHEGNFKLAKKLIHLAYKAKVDAVKFQTFDTEEFINKKDKKRFEKLKKFELTKEQFIELKKLAHSKKLKFISTPLDIKSADFLIQNSDIIKIASSDNNFFPMIDKIISSKKNVIISTGLTNIREIFFLRNRIYRLIGKKLAHERIAFLHCVTSYPVKDEFANLNSVKYLIDKLNFVIGYSDHTLGIEAAIAAVAKGAVYIEKHFTLNKKMKGPDHKSSLELEEFKSMVASCNNVSIALGTNKKKLTNSEVENIKIARRSIVAHKYIKKNTKFSFRNLTVKRPGTGIKPMNLDKLIGKKSKNNYEIDQLIKSVEL